MPPRTGAPSAWTTPAELALQVQRLWDKGRILSAGLTGDELFPLTLRLRRPGAGALGDEFDSVRAWIRALEEGAKPEGGLGYEIIWEEINNRRLGRNRTPSGAVVTTRADALALIGKTEEAARFDALVRASVETAPELSDWLARRSLAALEHAADWESILAVLAWFRAHPRCGLYLRQADIPGVDTKFIETRKGLLSELLDQMLPPGAVDAEYVGLKNFEARYGIRTKPALVRFRILDPRQAVAGLTDLTIPAEQFAGFEPLARRIFITENEVNGLAFPELEDSLVVFGLGYGLGLLSDAVWLQSREIQYWGDIDTHGFAMLDKLRSWFPHARSLLMDRETLIAHWRLRCEEDSPWPGRLDRLTPAESALYDDLRFDRLARRVRLEQERVSFGWLLQALTPSGGSALSY